MDDFICHDPVYLKGTLGLKSKIVFGKLVEWQVLTTPLIPHS